MIDIEEALKEELSLAQRYAGHNVMRKT
jgi:hypothetical protein